MTTTFETKAQWLAWRAEWRTEYKALSEKIRQTKLELKEKNREFSLLAHEHGFGWYSNTKTFTDDQKALYTKWYFAAKATSKNATALWLLSLQATAMLEELAEIKAAHKAKRKALMVEAA